MYIYVPDKTCKTADGKTERNRFRTVVGAQHILIHWPIMEQLLEPGNV